MELQDNQYKYADELWNLQVNPNSKTQNKKKEEKKDFKISHMNPDKITRHGKTLD